MKQRPSVAPYMSSADISTNASISLAKLYKRIRAIDPAYEPSSRFQVRMKNKRAALRPTLRIVR